MAGSEVVLSCCVATLRFQDTRCIHAFQFRRPRRRLNVCCGNLGFGDPAWDHREVELGAFAEKFQIINVCASFTTSARGISGAG